MTEETLVYFGYQTVQIILWLSLPPILVATGVGLAVALFQALTQIQEQTLVFAVKLVGVTITLMILVPWIGDQLISFLDRLLESFPYLTR
ncbi:type III secretion system export apparatus subunit SctS [Aestuariispira insulae]|uniref:Type III secretion protein S n=1 Tax=Aestuariispira insulae TaxID=1461337 RepID=A0A3D9H2J0_9PROT|nr:type III secretion system export apparatus subunit SctS [Aestuariispira insulae]RED43737.1 type III secretion protein S [Aestuariispira insulae]